MSHDLTDEFGFPLTSVQAVRLTRKPQFRPIDGEDGREGREVQYAYRDGIAVSRPRAGEPDTEIREVGE